MITFQCSSCNCEFTVNESEAGKRAKCTRCGTMMRIPEKSYRALQVYEQGGIFQNEQLDYLYDSFLEHYENAIVSHRVFDGPTGAFAMLELSTRSLRTQLISILMLELDGDPRILISSIAGKVEYQQQAYIALKATKLQQGMALEIADDDLLRVGVFGRLEWFNEMDFSEAIIAVATHADAIEDVLFGGDVH